MGNKNPMSLYNRVKRIYKRLVPKPLRHATFLVMPLPLKRLRHHLIRILERWGKHDEIYDANYYSEIVDMYMVDSCDTIAESIIDAFSPRSVIDVGCGGGLLLVAMKRRGISCWGLEYSKAALEICRGRGLDVVKFDLEHDVLPIHFKADLVTSTEVAEHLPSTCADRFVDILCTIGDTVVMTAAQPKPTSFGTDHVNEQPKEYWIEKFANHGFKYNQTLSMQWRKLWKKRDVAGCFWDGVMVFCKEFT
jgi:SAM-dependent methyltransferase